MKLTKLKKHLAMLLSAAMVFTCLPATAMAAQADDDLVEEGAVIEDVEDEDASDVSAIEEELTEEAFVADEETVNAVEEAIVESEGDTIAAGVYAFNNSDDSSELYDTEEKVNGIKGFKLSKYNRNGGQHGMDVGSTGDPITMTFNLSDSATVKVQGCRYGKPDAFTASFEGGIIDVECEENVNDAIGKSQEGGGRLYTVKVPEAGTLVLTAVQQEYVHAVSVKYAEYGAVKWDFHVPNTNLTQIQNASGTVSSNDTATEGVENLCSENKVLYVDATNNGKLAQRETDAQANANTIITVPLLNGKNTVTVVSYPGSHNYKVGGKAATEDETVFTKVASEGDSVDIVLTDKSYLYSITRKNERAASNEKKITSTSTTYDFVNSGVTEKFTMTVGNFLSECAKVAGQNIAKIFYWGRTEESDGGFYLQDGYAQIRTNAVFWIPIKDDTTMIEYKQVGHQNNPDRLIHLGKIGSGYTVPTQKETVEVSIADITEYIETKDDQKYFPVYSNGDCKVDSITLVEYNPILNVEVTGKVNGATEKGIDTIKFTGLSDNVKGKFFTAKIENDDTFKVTLKRLDKDSTYVVGLGSTDYVIDSTNEANILKLTGNTPSSDDHEYDIAKAIKAEVSGKITGIDKSLVKGELKMDLVPVSITQETVSTNLVYDEAEKCYKYSASALAGVEYTYGFTNADDYEVVDDKGEAKIFKEAETAGKVVDVVATLKPLHKVEGSFITSDRASAKVTELSFSRIDSKLNKEEPEYKYAATIDGAKYSISLRDGEYVAEGKVDGYTVFDHVSVSGKDVTNDVYLKSTAAAPAAASKEYKKVLTVGTGKDFETVQAALNEAYYMKREAGQRVTIELYDEIYREQVVVNTPDITLVSKGSKPSTITWYYGTGYSYYSTRTPDSSSPLGTSNAFFYDEAAAVDAYMYEKAVSQTPGNWGATVTLTKLANNFRADGIIFENSFNRYVTEDELKDGVLESGALPDRTAENFDPKTSAAKERACTMYNRGADKLEFYNCEFLSSQDTINTGEKDEYSYWFNCVLEGTTDFICGTGNAIFDYCDIVFYGYSDKSATDSIILAPREDATFGYLFNYCNIKTTKYEGIETPTSGYLGRDWDQKDNDTHTEKTALINTIVEKDGLILDKGWSSMNYVSSALEGLHEFNTRIKGSMDPVDLSVRIAEKPGESTIGTATTYPLTSAEGYSVDKFLNGWKPVYRSANYDALWEQVLYYYS